MPESSTSPKGPQVFYLRDVTGFPVACVASVVTDVSPATSNLTIRYAMSVYNDYDRRYHANEFPYNDLRALEIAVGRLGFVVENNTSRKNILASQPGGRISNKARTWYGDKKTIKYTLVKHIADTTLRPQIKDACERWLLTRCKGCMARAFNDGGLPENELASHSEGCKAAESQPDGHA